MKEEEIFTDKEKIILRMFRDDYGFYARHNLFIQTPYTDDKTIKTIPFVFTQQQHEFNVRIDQDIKNKKPIRYIVVKPKQICFSTFCTGWLFHKAITRPDYRALIVSRDADQTLYLFDKISFFYRNLPPDMKPRTKTTTKRELIFDRSKTDVKKGLQSGVTIQTAGKMEGTALGQTTTAILCSEVAYWENPEKVLYSLLPTLPYIPMSALFIESTGNGRNLFYDLYTKAKLKKNNLTPFFVGWWQFEQYKKNLDDGWIDDLSSEEIDLINRYNVTKEQLYWRRFTIANTCNDNILIFYRNYPANDEEAFIFFDGETYFNQRKLLEYQQYITTLSFKTGDLVEKNNKVEFLEHPQGLTRIFIPPEPGKVYVIGGDPTGMGPQGSKACAQVLTIYNDKITQVATVHGRIESDTFGRLMTYLGKYYNNALLAPEISGGYGIATIREIQKMNYWNIYTKKAEINPKYGWVTSNTTRTPMLESLRLYINRGQIDIRDPYTVEELFGFIYEPKTEDPVSKKGYLSDTVMALAIAVQVLLEDYTIYNFEPEKKQPQDEIGKFIQQILYDKKKEAEEIFL